MTGDGPAIGRELARVAPDHVNDETLRELLSSPAVAALLHDLSIGPEVPLRVRQHLAGATGVPESEAMVDARAIGLCRSDTGVWPRIVLTAAREAGVDPLENPPDSEWAKLLFEVTDTPGPTKAESPPPATAVSQEPAQGESAGAPSTEAGEPLEALLLPLVDDPALDDAEEQLRSAAADLNEARENLRGALDWIAAAQAVERTARTEVRLRQQLLDARLGDALAAWTGRLRTLNDRAIAKIEAMGEARLRERRDPEIAALRKEIGATERSHSRALASAPEGLRLHLTPVYERHLQSLQDRLAEATAVVPGEPPCLHVGAVAVVPDESGLCALLLAAPPQVALASPDALARLQARLGGGRSITASPEEDHVWWRVPLARGPEASPAAVADALAKAMRELLAQPSAWPDASVDVVVEVLDGQLVRSLGVLPGPAPAS